MNEIRRTDSAYGFEMMFMGLNDGRKFVLYPCWLYKDGHDPLLVYSTEEDREARLNGYDSVTAASLSNRYLINWYWDLEDMSPKQLCIFAKDEYGVELPREANREVLFKAVLELARHAPQNRGRLVLMAHTVSMNYDATIEEIKRLQTPGVQGIEADVQTFEVWA